jgi:transposase
MARSGPLLNEAQWKKIAPLLPKPRKNRRGGRPWIENRRVLEGILWILQSGARWQDLPEEYPHPSTCWRRLVLPKRIENWSLTSLQQRLVKTGGRLVKHARYYWLLLAEGHLTRRLFGGMLRRIAALPSPAG